MKDLDPDALLSLLPTASEKEWSTVWQEVTQLGRHDMLVAIQKYAQQPFGSWAPSLVSNFLTVLAEVVGGLIELPSFCETQRSLGLDVPICAGVGPEDAEHRAVGLLVRAFASISGAICRESQLAEEEAYAVSFAAWTRAASPEIERGRYADEILEVIEDALHERPSPLHAALLRVLGECELSSLQPRIATLLGKYLAQPRLNEDDRTDARGPLSQLRAGAHP